ncbi:MAG: serine protease, partial [Nanoarchaeota archaeon]
MKNSEIIEKNRKAVILIELIIPKENNQSQISIRGTGFIISKEGKFITCAHVYDQIPENERQFLGVKVLTKTDEKGISQYDRFNIELIKADRENDLVLMQIVPNEQQNFQTIHKIGDAEIVREGDEAVFIGYPLATELLAMHFGI